MWLMTPANPKGNMHSSAMALGNETEMKDKSVLQGLSSNLVLQGT